MSGHIPFDKSYAGVYLEPTGSRLDPEDWTHSEDLFMSELTGVDVWLVQVEQSKVLIKEGGVQLTLTIVDTPGFGDAVDNSNWWDVFSLSVLLFFFQMSLEQ